MATSTVLCSLFLLLACSQGIVVVKAAQIQEWDWAAASTTDAMGVYQGGAPEFEDVMESEGHIERRSLYWKGTYYISYGALSANRVPCPPRSGRSYYTHNCFRAHGPVHPYTRGCSCISRCRR